MRPLWPSFRKGNPSPASLTRSVGAGADATPRRDRCQWHGERRVSHRSRAARRPHGTSVVTWPGIAIEITPAHAHRHFDVLARAGAPATSTVGLPGAQGPVGTGTQGAGVNTPRAAAVAATTAGLVGALHIPKGGMLATGAQSSTVAAG